MAPPTEPLHHGSRRIVRRRGIWLAATLALSFGLAACGGGDGGDGGSAAAPDTRSGKASTSGGAARSSGSDIPSPCLDEGSVTSAIGFPVTVVHETLRVEGDAVSCAYADDADQRSVQILVGPATAADEVLGEVRDKADAMSGAPAQSIDVGERGLAFGSPDASYAAAVDGDRVFAVSASSATAPESLGDKRAAVTSILDQVIAVAD